MKSSLNIVSSHVRAIRIFMLQHSLSIHDLGRMLGLHGRTVSNLLSNSFSSRVARFKVEAMLGFPLWSSKEEFTDRMQLKSLLGFDPCLASFKRLQQTARKYHVRGWACARRKEILIGLLDRSLIKKQRIKRCV